VDFPETRSRTVTDEAVSTAVVELVASARDVDPTDLDPPLHDVVDPERLDALHPPSGDGARSSERAQFWFHGCRVTVSAGARVTVVPAPRLMYRLTCVDCNFETLLEGTARRAFDVASDHQSTYGRSAESHFVEFESTDERRARSVDRSAAE
jgi:hypothetical protein